MVPCRARSGSACVTGYTEVVVPVDMAKHDVIADPINDLRWHRELVNAILSIPTTYVS